jgi:hypothetical protein
MVRGAPLDQDDNLAEALAEITWRTLYLEPITKL